MANVFVTSDLHFNHNQDFIYEARGFDSITEHDYEIIERWNQIIRPQDIVYFLGDVGMSAEIEYLYDCVTILNGRIKWILGNHDTNNRVKKISELSHIEVIGHATTIKHAGKKFYLSHYPTLSSPADKPMKQSVINLCGHSHTQDKWADWKDYKIYHCELDAHNCYPILLDEVCYDLRNRPCVESV